MSDIHFLTQGLAGFDAFLNEEYGKPLKDWPAASDWSDVESLQMSRALGVMMKEPIAEASALSAEDSAAQDTGARRRWTISDAKIASEAFASSWQYGLLADIENAQEKEPGQMAVPADPRRFALFITYQRGYFSVLADHLLRLLCDRVKLPAFASDPQLSPETAPTEEAVSAAALLRQVPGLEQAEASFIAGLVFLQSKLGARGFCDWCDDRSSAQSDDRL
jgi:hypothetical protein